MASPQPLVSIIVTSYNYVRFIGQTIRSVLEQSYPELELIIWDDCSTDDSLEVIRSFSDERIRVIASRENCGPYAAYNQAALLCRGDYLGTIDSDDWITPDKLEKQVHFFEDHPEVGIVATNVTAVDAEGVPLGEDNRYQQWFNQNPDFNSLESWICENHICHASALMRRSVRNAIGAHDPALVAAADYEYWVRCLRGGVRFHMLPERLTCYRIHGGNVTVSRELRGCIELAYVLLRMKDDFRAGPRKDLYELAVRRIFDWCYMGGAGKVLAEMVQDRGLESGDFRHFLQEYDNQAAREPGVPRLDPH